MDKTNSDWRKRSVFDFSDVQHAGSQLRIQYITLRFDRTSAKCARTQKIRLGEIVWPALHRQP